ncbi:galactitol-1-phosphate 5-dehydrogenase [uncultured Mailhella sp.]|uniref:galactitol-1-phosphate 5-dehydrogenase n=1 Tax=uncultured Mailhella sp. TaxID=1981031 RepID=UPI0025D2F15D|nr:galactitol-1-phosphate 5-dehydrogenase [uncultured Mailhella sp.]
MKACVLEAVNKLIYKDVDTPSPKKGEVLVHIKACGICSSDFARVLKSGTYHFPTIPGHEFSGIVEQVGEGVSPHLIGKKVAVFPLLPCNSCPQCREKHYAQCAHYNYFGSRCDGGFAEFIAVPVWNIQPVSDDVPYEVAALAEPAAVAWHAVAVADIQKGEKVGISGTGTIAMLAGLWARRHGAEVVFFARTEAKEKFLKSFQGFHVVRLKEGVTENDASSLPGGMDVMLESVGTIESVKNSIELVKSRGRIVLIGNPAGDICLPQKVYWKLLRSEITVTGIWNSSYPDDWQAVIRELSPMKDDLAKLITHKFPLSTGQKAFEELTHNAEFFIKGMYVNE